MKVQIRSARPDDAGAIASVAMDALDMPIDADSSRVRKILGEGLTFVAIVGDETVGFADSFFTLDPAGCRRYELDLLAVASTMQGNGVGRRLVRKCLAVASGSDAKRVRALVRCANMPMQRICQALGFTCSRGVYELHTVKPRSAARPIRSHKAHLIAVETLSYKGIWLEGALCQDAIEAAHWTASQRNVSVIGAAIPSQARDTVELLRANSFVRVGEYQWWTANPQSG